MRRTVAHSRVIDVVQRASPATDGDPHVSTCRQRRSHGQLRGGRALVREIERLRAELDKPRPASTKLDELAHKDPLVHLPDRRRFIAGLSRLITPAPTASAAGAAIIFVDVDGLKAFNDAFGHHVGRRGMIEVPSSCSRASADQLRRAHQAADSSARLCSTSQQQRACADRPPDHQDHH